MNRKLFTTILIIIGMLSGVWIDASLANTSRNILVSPDYLMRKEGKAETVILDCRSNEDYLKGHIPESVWFNIDETFQKGDSNKPASMTRLKRLFERAGVKNNVAVYVYDDGSLLNASRVFWLLEVLGHLDVYVINGGYPSWANYGFEISRDSEKKKGGKFNLTVDPDRLITKFSMRLAIDNPNKMIVDARSGDSFKGYKKDIDSNKNDFQNNRALKRRDRIGHIPGAVSIPWYSVYKDEKGDDPLLKEEGELGDIFATLREDKYIFIYGENGKQSTFLYFILRNIGRKAAVYGGGWNEWKKDRSLPIEVDQGAIE